MTLRLIDNAASHIYIIHLLFNQCGEGVQFVRKKVFNFSGRTFNCGRYIQLAGNEHVTGKSKKMG